MFRKSTFAAILWMLAIALLPVRMANAHLHFCLDGQQQPVSVHVQDVGIHAPGDHAEAGHDDRDVELSSAASLAKLPGVGDSSSMAILHVYVLATVLPITKHAAPIPSHFVSDRSSVSVFRPPVRGPPV